ncbi:hypothetical protein MMC14_000201 [Varicellaria rhodocarpa]|nr:hypothetical protein [Varicellaria rhodocarpa]
MASANNLGAFVTGSEKEKEFPPQKRRKITKELGSNLQPTQLNVVPVPATTLGDGDTNTELPLQILPPDLYHLQSKYEFTSMSIISSSKIELKVRSLQRRLEKFSFADTKAKPQVVALHAKAPVVSKMVTIVQIVKRNIEKEKSKWWQYSKLHGQIIELDETPKKGRERGKMLREWESNRAAASGPDPAASTLDGTAVEADGEDDQAFEMMDTNDQQAEARKRIRAVPIMTIYMSMVPVKELREAYSEQTNAPTKV